MAEGVSLVVDTSEVQNMLTDVVQKLRGPELLNGAGLIVQQSVKHNFMVSGRPTKWEPLKYRRGQPLRKTGRLMNSITKTVVSNKVYVGTNVVYAGTQHFGAKKGEYGRKRVRVKPHSRRRGGRRHQVRGFSRWMVMPWGDIPARPFMLVQDEDVAKIEQFGKTLIEG